MTEEEWREIEEILAAALKLPADQQAGYLDRACANRPQVRAQVEALLAVRPQADAAFKNPPAPAWAGAFAAVSAGSRLGPYEIIEMVGAGGMGEVFKARDSRLGRLVAIKMLPRHKLSDPDRKRRFVQEARAASALNHPNIVTVYDIANDEQVDYLVMEYVAGNSLDRLISRKRVRLAEALGYAAQVADALAAAHAAGIVHRDIKPANLMVTAESQIKILDFGLAKLVEAAPGSEGETQSQESVLTEAGTVMGTVGYMSPQQAMGQPLDHRTDIFSMGVVLYEMAAGRRPFVGKSPVETLHAIINDPVPPLPAQPHELEEILARALAKDPRERYQHAGDLAFDLRRLQRASESSSLAPAPLGLEPRRRLWAAALLLILTGAAAWLFRGRSAPLENPLTDAQFARITDFPGVETAAAISPDGRFVAFLADRDGPFDIFLSQVGSGRFVNLTQGREPNLSALSWVARVIDFSSDGSEICFHDADSANSMQVMPLMGGPPRILLGRRSQEVAWSQDGSRLVYHTSDPGDPIFVADRTGANPRQIFVGGPSVHNHFPVWSPDGKWIYFVSGLPAANDMDLWRIAPAGGVPERLTQLNSKIGFPTPISSRTLLYSALDAKGAGPWLWALDVQRKVTRRLNFGLERYTSLAASGNGRRLAVSVANPVANLWSVPILDRPAEEGDVKPFPVPTMRALMPRFGGAALFYLSSQDAGDGLWRYQDGQALEIWKGANGALLEPPAVSPDGRRVAFVLRRNGKLRLQVEMADGTDLQAVAENLDVQGAASWSPDGQWIVTGGADRNGAGLFKIPAGGGALVRLTTGVALNPVWAPDESLIAYTGANVGGYGPLRLVRPDGSAVELPEIRLQRDGERVRFLPRGIGLVYASGISVSNQDFWLLDLNTKNSRRITHLANTAIMRTFDITPDGKQIVFDRLRENSDIALVDLVQGDR
jgi:serine/threonine protein kinase/Tol biopolymer transport system component